MMFTTTPYILENAYRCPDREELVRQLKKLGADYVVLFTEFNDMDEKCKMIRELIPYFDGHGLKTALWLREIATPFVQSQKLVNEHGVSQTPLMCPLNPQFAEQYRVLFRKYAETGIKTIMFEDDFRMQMVGDAACCFCEDHMAFYRELLGEDLPREELAEKMLRSGPGKYRDAWIEGCQHALRTLARLIREELDKVDPDIEVILDCGPTLFGGDGTDPFELTDILKGTGRPMMRLIGGPYWQDTAKSNLMSVLDFSRHQAYECRKRVAVCLGEVDVYPRPRYTCPSAYAEFFHTAMIADGNFDGVHKYGLDYVSSVYYETGYAEETERNKPLYAEIERIFRGKRAVGVKPFEPFDIVKYTAAVAPAPEQYVMFTPTRDLCSGNSIPTTFEGDGPHLVFGDNAWAYQPEQLKNGTILDITAAKILTERGMDVGLVRAEPCDTPRGPGVDMLDYERFHEYDENILTPSGTTVYDISLKPGATVLSEFDFALKRFISSYSYENAEGMRFLVYGFDGRNAQFRPGLLNNYCRQRQLMAYYEWLSGKKLDAACPGNPYLYTLVKKDENSLAIGLWNFCADRMLGKVIELAEAYREAEFIGCTGQLVGNRIFLEDAPLAFAYCFIHLKK